MGNKYYVENPKKFILEFLDDQFGKDLKLEEKLKKFREFSFWDITDKQRYRNKRNDADGDCTNLAYAIAWCLWGDDIRKCVENYTFEDLLIGKDFSGDTICTWNTLFNDSRIFFLLEFSEIQLKQIQRFFKLYQSIGNFYLLPKETVKFNSKNVSLNSYRGDYKGFKDYFDTFRDALIKKNDNTINSLIDKNNFFFNTDNSWEKLKETFDLQAAEKIRFKNHFKHSEFIQNQADYREHILEYTEKSIKMIEDRSKAIIEKLAKVLE